MHTITRSEQETIDLAIKCANTLVPRDVVLLHGELGTGKTCFVRGLCQGLGGDPSQVHSPTYTIVHEYEIASGNRLVHIDAYRLKGEEELDSIGLEDLLSDTRSIFAIEWPSKIEGSLPTNAIKITIEHVGRQERLITMCQSDSGDMA